MIDPQNDALGKVFNRLNERVKELNCIYSIEELLRDKQKDKVEIFNALLDLIPPGWQYPTVCVVRIHFEGIEFKQPDFVETEWVLSSDIVIDDNIAGRIDVFYTQLIREKEGSQFIAEEQKLLHTITERVSSFIFSQRLRKTLDYFKTHDMEPSTDEELKEMLPVGFDEHWKWRLKMAQLIAEKLDFQRFGLEGIYVIGSTKNANAGAGSDIDLIAHFRGDPQQRCQLTSWMEGWGMALAEMNYSKTGYKSIGSLVDLHIVTDEDIRDKTSYAVMIGRVTDGARLLRKK